MAKAAALAVYLVVFGGGAAIYFILSLCGLLRWRRKRFVSNLRLLLILLPLLSLVAAAFLWMLSRVPRDVPASREDLLQVSAPVESVREYATRRFQGRYRVQKVKQYYIYLEGYLGGLYIPKEYKFDQDAFLRWAGPDVVTFRYLKTDEYNLVYAIEKEDGSVFLDYAWAVEARRSNAVESLADSVLFLLFFSAMALQVPPFLYPKDARSAMRVMCLLLAAGSFGLLLWYGAHITPDVSETPADTSPQITVVLRQGVEVTLPRGWAEGAFDENDGTQWYKAQENISTCFRVTECTWELPEEEWSRELLAGFREYILETFIKKPRESLGAFLPAPYRSGALAPGTDFWVSDGWGASVNNYKNHFLVVLLPQAQCQIVIQSSSKSLSWAKLQAYVEEWVYPLLNGFVVEGLP